MHILGCFKSVPDLERMGACDWCVDETLAVETDFLPVVVNCFDEGALELMLRCAAQSETVALSALTVGAKKSENTLKTLYALGFAQCVRVDSAADLRFAPTYIAEEIAQYLTEHPEITVVVLGDRTADGANGATAPLLAERLGWQCITQVTDFTEADGALRVTAQTDEGVRVQTVQGAAVLSVGNVAGGYLRTPTMKDRRERGRRPIEVRAAAQIPSEKATLSALQVPDTARACVRIKGETPEKCAEQFYEQYWKAWVRE